MHFRSKQTLNLALRYNDEGIVVIRASNDTLNDSYGTVIPVEVLMRVWLGFMAHHTISSQHALHLRGIAGQPQIGMATRVDFTPQLEVTRSSVFRVKPSYSILTPFTIMDAVARRI